MTDDSTRAEVSSTKKLAELQSLVDVVEADVRSFGFTESGVAQFTRTVKEYGLELAQRAIGFGEINAAPNMDPEITHDNVRAAAHSIAATYGTPDRPTWLTVTHIGEYLATAAAGLGAGHLDKTAGIAAFVLGIGIGVLLIAVRLFRES